MKNLILFTALTLSLSVQADDPVCTVIALSMFTSKYIELNGCGVTGNTSARALDFFGNCRLNHDVVQTVMATAKNNVAGMTCLKSKDTYLELTNVILKLSAR